MGLLDFFKKTSGREAENPSVNVPVLGRQSDDIDNIIDDELPSVNRRKGKSKLIDILGFSAILCAGLAMIYYINTDTQKKIEKKPKKQEIANYLPPLDMPQPPPPQEVIVPPVEPTGNLPSQPIALKNKQQVNKVKELTWGDRKMMGQLVLGGDRGSINGNKANQLTDSAKPFEKQDAPTTLALKLKPTISQGVSASMLPNRDYLITKGTALDCALETAIDSTVPGLTTCRLTRDVYSDNGHVVLLDRGSQLVGEYQGGITAGQARIFLLWTRVKTPNGVIVNLDSPGTDALGRAGNAGWVDRHFIERFGAAIVMSLLKDSISYAKSAQASKNGGSTVTIGGENSDQIATEILKNTVNIPPTLYVNQGEHVQIMVARDLDFSTVYGLELKE